MWRMSSKSDKLPEKRSRKGRLTLWVFVGLILVIVGLYGSALARAWEVTGIRGRR